MLNITTLEPGQPEDRDAICLRWYADGRHLTIAEIVECRRRGDPLERRMLLNGREYHVTEVE